MRKIIITAAIATVAALPVQGMAQTISSGIGSLEAGYGNARAMESATFNPSTRDSQGNRIIKDGVIQTGSGGSQVSSGANASSAVYGAAFFESGANSSATAIGNLVNITVEGSNNTIVLNSIQNNSGNITANSKLNGRSNTANGSVK